jgi:ABC-type nitrate/sulfonate/bicarbonate transport system permease component
MTQAKWCEGCSQAHDCKKIYERLGSLEGPSVAVKAAIAFALPIGVFIAALGLFDRLLQHAVASPYRTLCAFALALSVTIAFMLVVSFVTKQLHKRRR